jgi:hypothetical protein
MSAPTLGLIMTNYSQAANAGSHRDAFGHSPALVDAIALQPKVVMQGSSLMLLDDESHGLLEAWNCLSTIVPSGLRWPSG